MCKVNWEERIFQMVYDINVHQRVSMEEAFDIAERFKESYVKIYKERYPEKEKPKEDEEEALATAAFIEKMYKMYPTKCPVQNRSLGKSTKDKEKIKNLLKTYSKEQIERVFKEEIDSKYGKGYMRNLSTFLNNFPDPYANETIESKSNGIINERGEVWSEQLGKWLK